MLKGPVRCPPAVSTHARSSLPALATANVVPEPGKAVPAANGLFPVRHAAGCMAGCRPALNSGQGEVTQGPDRSRYRWVEWMKSQGLKFPCGRKPKGAPRIVLPGKEALDRKAMHREELRLQRARRKEIEKQTPRDRLEREQEERARVERDKLLGIRPAGPPMTNGALVPTGMINWDRVMERERIRLLVAQAEAAWWRNGGWATWKAARCAASRACLTIRAIGSA
jgi:hypothetical protein